MSAMISLLRSVAAHAVRLEVDCKQVSHTSSFIAPRSSLMHMIALGLFCACFAMQEQLLGHNPNTHPNSELCFDMGRQVSAVSFDTILTRYGRHALLETHQSPLLKHGNGFISYVLSTNTLTTMHLCP